MEKINNKIKFDHFEMIDLWEAMHDVMEKHTVHYKTDFLISMLSIEDKKEIDQTLILLCRESGVELGNCNDVRIKAYSKYDETKYCQDYHWYVIDVGKYSRLKHMPHFSYLYNEEQEECCIREVSVNAIRNLIKGDI